MTADLIRARQLAEHAAACDRQLPSRPFIAVQPRDQAGVMVAHFGPTHGGILPSEGWCEFPAATSLRAVSALGSPSGFVAGDWQQHARNAQMMAELRNLAPETARMLRDLADEVQSLREHALRAERIVEAANRALDESGAPRRDAQGTMPLGQRIRALAAAAKENPR